VTIASEHGNVRDKDGAEGFPFILFLIFLRILFQVMLQKNSSDVYNALFQIEDTRISENNLTECGEYGEVREWVLQNYPLSIFQLWL